MVHTKIDLKLKIKERIGEIDRPFKTSEITEFAKSIAPNVWANSHRISKYIRASDIAEFNKRKKVWEIKTKSDIGVRRTRLSREIERTE